MNGMATSAEAERLLGVTRLRKNRAIIRPDLYRKATAPGMRMIFTPAEGGLAARPSA
jgi:hypothetical protein